MPTTPRAPRLAPIAIFAFNRPYQLRQLFRSLLECPEFEKSEVTVFIDGPRDDQDARKIAEARLVVEDVSHDRTRIEAASRNRGLKASISAGVTDLCASHAKVIVLEDDLEVSPDFLTYMNAALEKYADHSNVWSVCGDIPEIARREPNSARFLPVGNSWGWATWERAWSKFDSQYMVPTALLKDKVFRQRFSVNGLRDFPAMLEQEQKGRISSWYIYWHLAMTLHGGLSLFPPVPMTRNLGFSGGTHASSFNLFRFSNTHKKQLGRYDFTLPDDVKIDFPFLNEVIRSSEWRLLRWNSKLGAMKRLLVG